MQTFIVLASLVSELAGGQPPPSVLNVTKNTLVLQGLKGNSGFSTSWAQMKEHEISKITSHH